VVGAALIAIAGCAHGTTVGPIDRAGPLPLPRTRAERTSYAETSSYADVIAFIDSLQKIAVPMSRQELGRTNEGRVQPLLVLSRPQVTTPEQARALNRPIVYVQANIHAGEVEGKEALLALVRDLATTRNNVLDSIVLIAIPIYNADGNERFGPQSVNRTEQNGPESVGQRPNAQMLDLNRDYVKAEAPETRASLAAFEKWNPDVFVDLHTTDGSFHGYALTYAPSLADAREATQYSRDSLLPELRRRMKQREGLEVFDYGNFDTQYEERDITDTVKSGWYTYDNRPRFGTNYFGLRQRIAVLSEAYSHDPFEKRVRSTYAFVRELLSLVAEKSEVIRLLGLRADSYALTGADFNTPVAIQSRLAVGNPRVEDVPFELMAHTGDSSLTQPGVPRGFRRTGVFKTQTMPVYDRFEAVLIRTIPRAWLLPASDTAAIELLRLHGVRVERVRAGMASARISRFMIDSIHREPKEFQGHHEMRVSGSWRDTTAQLPNDMVIVRSDQTQAIVALYLLEPESDDGLVTWNVFDGELAPGKNFPVWRVAELPGAVH
jgi:hypothetical protein